MRAEVEGQHLVVEGAEVGGLPDEHDGRPGVRAEAGLDDLAPVADADAMEHLVAPGEVRDAVGDGRRSVDVIVGLQLPEERTILDCQRVQVPVVGADQDAVAGNHG